MKKIFLFLLIIVILIFAQNSFAQSNEIITLTAYYPAPYGVYQIVQLYPINQPASCQQGQMYYDSGTKSPYYCDNTGWKSFGGYWAQDTTDPANPILYTKDVDLGENWRIGLGTKLNDGNNSPLRLNLGTADGANGGILAAGQWVAGASNFPESLIPGPYLIWWPERFAFRVGHQHGDTHPWNRDVIGVDSIAMGSSAQASGTGSFAVGTWVYATGDASFALGGKAEASAPSSFAIGLNVTAAANYSFVIGIGSLSGSPSPPLVNNIPLSLMVGFNSNIPTLYVGPSKEANTTGKVGIGTTDDPLDPVPVSLHIKDPNVTDPNITPQLLIEGRVAEPAAIGLVNGNPTTSPVWLVENSSDNFKILRNTTLTGGAPVERVNINNAGDFQVTGEVKITGVSADGTGKAVCIKNDGNLGTCGGAPDASGACTPCN